MNDLKYYKVHSII